MYVCLFIYLVPICPSAYLSHPCVYTPSFTKFKCFSLFRLELHLAAGFGSVFTM